jgi:glycosyltransferase involved in cell wall biosynthesis
VGALNFGLSKCTGAYIARFDADDLMLEGRLSTQLEVMNDGDLDIVGVNVTYMIGDRFSIPKISLPLKASTSANIFPYRNPIMHSWLTRRGVYDLLSGYRMISYAEDYDFIGRALLKGLKVGSIPSRLQIQREREGNTATTNYKKQVASQILVSRAFCRRTLLERRFEDEFPEQLKMLLDRFDFMSFLFERGPFPRPLRSRFHFHAYLHAAICRMKL